MHLHLPSIVNKSELGQEKFENHQFFFGLCVAMPAWKKRKIAVIGRIKNGRSLMSKNPVRGSCLCELWNFRLLPLHYNTVLSNKRGNYIKNSLYCKFFLRRIVQKNAWFWFNYTGSCRKIGVLRVLAFRKRLVTFVQLLRSNLKESLEKTTNVPA